MPHLSLVSLAAKISRIKPVATSQKAVYSESDSLLWPLLIVCSEASKRLWFLEGPSDYACQGWGNEQTITLFPGGGVPNIPKESPISAPCTCHVLEDSHVNKVIAGLIYWSHFSLKLDLGCKIWRHFIAFRCRPLWFHPYFPHAKKRSPPSLLQILLKQLPCRHRIWSL